MSKTFTYTRQSGPSYYSEETDEEFCDEEDFEYEVDWQRIRDALIEIIVDDKFSGLLKIIPGIQEDKELKRKVRGEIEKSIRGMISDYDIDDTLTDYYEDDLKDYFEKDAMDSWDSY